MQRVKTKIVCTLGPASDSEGILRRMMQSGMDVARLNFSHGSHKSHLRKIQLIRKLNKRYHRNIQILQDLEGFRIRIGELNDKPNRRVELKKHQTVFLTNKDNVRGDKIIPFDYEGSLTDIKAGSHVYVDDGNIALLVKSASNRLLKTVVIVSGTVKEHKGINIPNVNLKFKGVTKKDISDLIFGLSHNVDFVAQSFVRNAKDVLNVREIIESKKKKCRLIAKIENHEGIKNIDKILDASDGIMVARGDMGVCLPIYEIPMIQKMIIKKCNAKKKFVITATQMLESMTEHLRPTRAEVTDVANAIIDGTNYVMLSEETAAGKYPVETVHMMNQICKFTEQY